MATMNPRKPKSCRACRSASSYALRRSGHPHPLHRPPPRLLSLPKPFERKAIPMRILIAAAAFAVTLSLAGCGEGSAFDNGFRTSFRENAVTSCVTSSRTAPTRNQFDWQRLCGCAIDRYMNGKSSSDLRSATPEDPALRAATEQCAMEQVGGASAPAETEDGNSSKPAG